MSRYEERLDAFVLGRQFARMSRPVRNRADVWCDVCGSVQARVLFGVRDTESKEVFFVGEHCLQELSARGAVVRRFSRESAEEAYAVRCAASPPSEATLLTESRPAEPKPKAVGMAVYLVFDGPSLSPSPVVVPLTFDSGRTAKDRKLQRAWPALLAEFAGGIGVAPVVAELTGIPANDSNVSAALQGPAK